MLKLIGLLAIFRKITMFGLSKECHCMVFMPTLGQHPHKVVSLLIQHYEAYWAQSVWRGWCHSG